MPAPHPQKTKAPHDPIGSRDAQSNSPPPKSAQEQATSDCETWEWPEGAMPKTVPDTGLSGFGTPHQPKLVRARSTAPHFVTAGVRGRADPCNSRRARR